MRGRRAAPYHTVCSGPGWGIADARTSLTGSPPPVTRTAVSEWGRFSTAASICPGPMREVGSYLLSSSQSDGCVAPNARQSRRSFALLLEVSRPHEFAV